MLDKTQTALITVNAATLVDAIKRVRHAVCEDPTRFYLGGIFAHKSDSNLRLVATDGHRLASQLVALDNACPDFAGAIISDAAIGDMLKTEITKSKYRHRDVILSVGPGRVSIAGDSGSLSTCEPIDATFPDYGRVIPAESENLATVDRQSFHAIVAGIAAFYNKATDSKFAAPVKLTFDGETLTLEASPFVLDSKRNEIRPTISATLPLLAPAKAPLAVGFNAAYLRDIAGSLQGSDLTFHLTDAGSPCRIVGDTAGHDTGALHVLMPVRL